MQKDDRLIPPEQKNQYAEQPCQTGKTFEDLLPYLLSGEADDLSTEFTSKI